MVFVCKFSFICIPSIVFVLVIKASIELRGGAGIAKTKSGEHKTLTAAAYQASIQLLANRLYTTKQVYYI